MPVPSAPLSRPLRVLQRRGLPELVRLRRLESELLGCRSAGRCPVPEFLAAGVADDRAALWRLASDAAAVPPASWSWRD